MSAPIIFLISAVAENYLKLTIGPSDDRIVPTAGHLDPRLHLPLCSVALNPYLRPGAKMTGRTIVGVRCSGSKPWKIYLPVYVAVMEDVVIEKSAMQRDYLIQSVDVTIARRDVSGLAGGYLSRIRDIVGHRLKQSVAPGVGIRIRGQSAACWIRRPGKFDGENYVEGHGSAH